MGIFPLGDDKVSINHLFGPNFVMRTLKLDTLVFFENRHFFHKKWLINIYFTSENHNSLRKYHSNISANRFEIDSEILKKFDSMFTKRGVKC